MRLLLDTCVWGGAKESLLAEGHDVVWSGDWSEDPGDEEILARACETQLRVDNILWFSVLHGITSIFQALAEFSRAGNAL